MFVENKRTNKRNHLIIKDGKFVAFCASNILFQYKFKSKNFSRYLQLCKYLRYCQTKISLQNFTLLNADEFETKFVTKK